jgi:hypothetical protein
VAAARVAERPTWCAHQADNLGEPCSAGKATSVPCLPAGSCNFDPKKEQDALAAEGCDFSSPVVRKRQFGYNGTVTRQACISREYWQNLWSTPRFFEASDAKSGRPQAVDFEPERLLIMVMDQNVGNHALETLARVGTKGWQ